MVAEAVDRQELCQEFDRAIDDLETARRDCPGELWEASMWHVPRTDAWVWPASGTEPVPARTDESIRQFSAFWVVGYHCLWFLDFYVTADPSGFESPEYVRDGPEEMPWPADGAAPLTDRVFSKEALLAYAEHGRGRVRKRIESRRSHTPERTTNGAPRAASRVHGRWLSCSYSLGGL